jgi:hypothetical protein
MFGCWHRLKIGYPKPVQSQWVDYIPGTAATVFTSPPCLWAPILTELRKRKQFVIILCSMNFRYENKHLLVAKFEPTVTKYTELHLGITPIIIPKTWFEVICLSLWILCQCHVLINCSLSSPEDRFNNPLRANLFWTKPSRKAAAGYIKLKCFQLPGKQRINADISGSHPGGCSTWYI